MSDSGNSTRSAASALRRALDLFSINDAIVLAFCTGAFLIGKQYGIVLNLTVLEAAAMLGMLVVATGFIAFLLFAAAMCVENVRHRIRFGSSPEFKVTARKVLAPYNVPSMLWEGWRALASFTILSAFWSHLKTGAPSINPALYDGAFERIDEILFFGFNPAYELSHSSFFSHPAVARFFDSSYISWYAVKLPVFLYFALRPDRRFFRSFVLAFNMMWIVHMACFLLWPSLGPVYIHKEWFDPLNMPAAHALQSFLWSGYTGYLADPHSHNGGLYEGIAAFPSLHVGLVGLYAIYFFKVRRSLGVLMSIFTVIILIGSCLTGWHYICDGLFGCVMAWGCFRLGELLENRSAVATIRLTGTAPDFSLAPDLAPLEVPSVDRRP